MKGEQAEGIDRRGVHSVQGRSMDGRDSRRILIKSSVKPAISCFRKCFRPSTDPIHF